MKNNGLFSALFIEDLKAEVRLDDAARGRMATLAQTWRTRNTRDTTSLWESFLKQALGYLEFVPPTRPDAPGIYPLFEDWGFNECISVLVLVEPGANIDDTSVGRFYPAQLVAHLREHKLNWGILTDGTSWRLYSTKSSRPYEDYVELPLAEALEVSDEGEYGLFERFFHKDSFIAEDTEDSDQARLDEAVSIYKCRLDRDRERSEQVLEEWVKEPFLSQVDEVLQYICNGFIADTPKTGEEYTEEERAEIFESAVKLIYRCLFLFYAEARRLLPSDQDKISLYNRHSIQALCREAHKFRWGTRRDTEHYDLWKHLKGLVNAVNEGDPEYGIMGYNGGLFDDEEEKFLGKHQLRNDFLSRALYLLAFVEPLDNNPDEEYLIPYEDLEVRHLGELYENILEFKVQLADADRIRRRTTKGVEVLLASQTTKKTGDMLIRKGDVYFGESALERKQTGSYYTPESLVRFLNEKAIIQPLREIFEREYRKRFEQFLEQAREGNDTGARRGAARSAAALIERFTDEVVLKFKVCDPAMGSGHFLVDVSNQMSALIVALLREIPYVEGTVVTINSHPNEWRRLITRHCIYGVDLNPLAVNLTKLSLWLNCFASAHKLTFLDHHVRCGNSLIGVRALDQLTSIPKRKKDKKLPQHTSLFDYDDLSSVLAVAVQEVETITRMDEDDTDSQKAAFDEAVDATSVLRPLADLSTAYLMDSSIAADDYKQLFECLAKGTPIENTLNPSLPEILKSVESYRDWHHFFHWPLEFPDAFTMKTGGGFSATVGNPPWDVLQPNKKEFYSTYDPAFRGYKREKALSAIKRLHNAHPQLTREWAEYESRLKQAATYFKEPEAYTCLDKGKVDLYKAFLERFHQILRDNSRAGVVIPGGIYSDESCTSLRKLLLDKCNLIFLYGFENRWPKVFPAVHNNFKFVVLGFEKGGTTRSFRCAFMEHGPERLPVIETGALTLHQNQIKQFSPDTLSMMELRSDRDISIVSHIYAAGPVLSTSIKKSWNAKFTQEFNLTTDIRLFKAPAQLKDEGFTELPGQYWVRPRKNSININDVKELGFRELREQCLRDNIDLMLPLYKGTNIYQFNNSWEPVWHCISLKLAEDRLQKANSASRLSYTGYRCAFRKIGRSADIRTLFAAVIQPSCSSDAFPMACSLQMTHSETVFLCGVMNSFIIDYIIRQKVNATINQFYVYSIPIPRCKQSSEESWFSAIVARTLRLTAVGAEYRELWNDVFDREYVDPNFWYPKDAAVAYGPLNEREVRKKLMNQAESFTPAWIREFGVYDKHSSGLDTGDRIQLRAEIDAYVAHLYGLSRDDFAYILDTFPVLQKKEEKVFGEFMSKRKCLEEYDRLVPVVGDHK